VERGITIVGIGEKTSVDMGEITCVCRGEITIVDMREIKRIQAWGENTYRCRHMEDYKLRHWGITFGHEASYYCNAWERLHMGVTTSIGLGDHKCRHGGDYNLDLG
jgi:hypothetical protein